MNLTWYWNRLRKMSLGEVCKRFGEHLSIYYSLIKYHDPTRRPYSHFADGDMALRLHSLPGIPVFNDWRRYQIYDAELDLTKPLDWLCSFNNGTNNNGTKWPACHYSKINHRPGNPYGDVRINWELNRLQFLPAMAITDEEAARNILADWLEKNPYLHGPAYLSSMEVALRWISIYRATCLFKQPFEPSLRRSLVGLAIASGKFVESRLSTHSSAGNHLVVEAVGLFWLGKALENNQLGARWTTKARKLLWEQTCRQIHPDGSSQEQSFWYLGFVLDALFHYFLLEERNNIPVEVWKRVENMLEFMDAVVLPDGSFPDYGDRDDGFIFRLHGTYEESPFPGLLNIGSYFYKRPEWRRDGQQSIDRLAFWTRNRVQDTAAHNSRNNKAVLYEKPLLKAYNHGGMTLMQWGKGRLLFRHSRLGLDNTYGHGHADALAVLFYWDNMPVLIDLGSGQYNGGQPLRDFFRSTLAHNTIEIGERSQARMLGPFMWKKSYETSVEEISESPFMSVKANHNGYKEDFSTIHVRKIEWPVHNQLQVQDSFLGPGGVAMRGAFHLGMCQAVTRKNNVVEADFDNFVFSVALPLESSVEVHYGSKNPFMGWRSTVYGSWEPIHTIVFSCELQSDHKHTIEFKIFE